MKKLYIITAILLAIIGLSSCGKSDENVIKVIATQIPHAEILNQAKNILDEQGYRLEIITTSDYYFPNPAVYAGDADANFFQHVPFLNAYNFENPNQQLVIGAHVHIEPIGLYADTYNSLSEIENGATILLSNSISDHGRALNLLAAADLITLKEGVDITSPNFDIQEAILTNPKNLVFKADVSPDFLISAYRNREADLYIINSNYVLEGGLNPLSDSIFIETTEDNPYVNILALKASILDEPKIKALIAVLESQAIQDFILTQYNGSVIPA